MERGGDGPYTLCSRTEESIQVAARHWEDGAELVASVLERADPALIIPGGPSEVAQALEWLVAERSLENDRDVAGELVGVVQEVHDAEELLDVEKVDRGLKTGLLVITSTRVLWLYDAVEPEVTEMRLEDITSVSVDSGMSDLVIATANQKLKLSVPKRSKQRLAE